MANYIHEPETKEKKGVGQNDTQLFKYVHTKQDTYVQKSMKDYTKKKIWYKN